MRRVSALLAAVLLAAVLCGCTFFATDTAELLSPPAIAGDLAPIDGLIRERAAGAFSYQYPSAGEYLSPVITVDLNGDGTQEAVALYRTDDGENVTEQLDIFERQSGDWAFIAGQKIVAGGVERIDFCDLDGDGTLEILAGWEIYGASEMQLAVYSLSGSTLSQWMLQRYTYFLSCDLNGDSLDEIFLVNFNPGENVNYAALYAVKDGATVEISGCSLDITVKSVNEPVFAALSNGNPAIYIDEIKGAGAITEVLYIEKNELVNPLLGSETRENTRTLRSSAIMCRDINEDGILEIPIYESLPSVLSKNNEALYYTNWCSYNGEALTNKLTTVMNLNDGYYLNIPPKWTGNLAVEKDSDNRSRVFYAYDTQTQTVGARLAQLRALEVEAYDPSAEESRGFTEILRTEETVYVCRCFETGDELAVTAEEIKAGFRLIEE